MPGLHLSASSIRQALNKIFVASSGVTRDKFSQKAQALVPLGVELAQADLHDEASLQGAIAGSYAVFAVTDYWCESPIFLFWLHRDNLLQSDSVGADADMHLQGLQHVVLLYDLGSGCMSRLPDIGEKEYDMSILLAKISHKAGVQVFIWASLPDFDRLSGGKYVWPPISRRDA